MNKTAIDEILCSEFILLFTGNFYTNFREPIELVKALTVLPQVKLIIAGDTSKFSHLFAELGTQVKLLGIIDHFNCLALQKQATMLVNIANKQSYQIPGKLFEYFAAQRPILHITPRIDDDTALLLNKLRRGITVHNQYNEIAKILKIAYYDWKQKRLNHKFNLSLESVKDYSWNSNANYLYKKINFLVQKDTKKLVNNKYNGIVLYDFLQVVGGAEKVSLTLVKNLPTSLCVGFINSIIFPSEEVSNITYRQLTHPTEIVGWQIIKTLFVFTHKTKFLAKYDWVIFSGSNAPVAVHNHPNGKNLLYCHTIPRFVYDLKYYYLSQAKWWQKPLLIFLISYVQPRYERAIEKMDIIIANSENVKRRIKKYLNRDAIVIYPPVEVDKYKWIKQGDYYLSTARVESYKRVELVVRAFMQMPDNKLIVASGGGDLERLQSLATGYSNIRFTGWCNDEQWQQLMGESIATIYIPIEEDFGMSPVESMAAGKPVIGVAEGGLLETVVHGETGVLIPEVSVDAVIEAVSVMSKDKALTMRDACENRAQLFRTEVFLEKMRSLI